MDFEVAKFINHLGLGFIDPLTVLVSSLALLAIFFTCTTFFILFWDKKNRWNVVMAVIIAIMLHFIVSELFFKYLLGEFTALRVRPYLAHPGDIIPIGKLNTDSSFPSSHMSFVLAILTVYVYYYRRFWPLAALFALLMGFSRIHNGMHYPTDVLAGAILGIFYALAAIRIAPVFLGLRRTAKIAVLLSLSVFFFLGYSYAVEPNMLVTEKQTFKLDCFIDKDLADEKFVQISDLHFTDKTKEARINQIYGSIKNIDPAAVFMTGDYVSNRDGLPYVKKLVEKISADYPVYAVFGNWDYNAFDFNIGEIRAVMEKAGAKTMFNDAVALQGKGTAGIYLLGVKDPYTSGDTKNDLDKAMKKIPAGDKKCSVLLAHSPEIIKEAAAENIDLVLVGHTHGGQIYIPFMTEKMIPVRVEGRGYVKGFYEVGKTQMYVNRGIGTSGLPFRFLVPPEITEISIISGGKKKLESLVLNVLLCKKIIPVAIKDAWLGLQSCSFCIRMRLI